MGWSSGSYVAEELWDELKDLLPEEIKQVVADKIYTIFEGLDADDWSGDPDGLWAIARPDEYQRYIDDEEEDYDMDGEEDYE